MLFYLLDSFSQVMTAQKNHIFNLKLQAKKHIYQNPLLFYPVSRIVFYQKGSLINTGKPSYTQLVNKDTQLVIEGFPRSSNTFSVLALQNAQPTPIKIAYHFHAPAQIIRAAKLEIPILVPIRDPTSVAASFVTRWPEYSVDQVLELYIWFHSQIAAYRDNYIVGDFREIIQDYNSIIQRINKKFGTNFLLVKNTKDRQFCIQKNFGDDRSSFVDKSRDLKIKIEKKIKTENCQMLQAAESIYQKFISF